jgi:hypothetical protein
MRFDAHPSYTIRTLVETLFARFCDAANDDFLQFWNVSCRGKEVVQIGIFGVDLRHFVKFQL